MKKKQNNREIYGQIEKEKGQIDINDSIQLK